MSAPQLERPGLQAATIAVTGAGGFIGGRLCQILAAQNGTAKVRGFSHRPGKGNQTRALRLDRPADVRSALAGCGALVHCAFDVNDMTSNIRIAQTLGEACADARIRMVHMSTAAVYEPLPDGVLDERFPVQRTDSYSAVKATIEDALMRLSQDRGLDLIILQPTIVYGPGGRAWTDSPVRDLLMGPVVLPAAGQGLCNAVFVDDVCQAAINAVTASVPPGERFLISGPQPVAWGDFFEAYADMLGDAKRVIRSIEPLAPAPPDGAAAPATEGWLKPWIRTTILSRISARNRSRANMAYRRFRAMAGRKAPQLPQGAMLQLFAARCDIHTAKARMFLDYRPEFGLADGMRQTRDYVCRTYAKQIARIGQSPPT